MNLFFYILTRTQVVGPNEIFSAIQVVIHETILEMPELNTSEQYLNQLGPDSRELISVIQLLIELPLIETENLQIDQIQSNYSFSN